MSKFLVTGAAGFIGAKLAEELINLGHEVITIDNLSTGIRKNVPAGVEFIEGNCSDAVLIKGLENHCFEAIFHIAGQSSGEISYEDPVYDLQSNTQSTLLLLNLALKTGAKKFIYASTMGVYGRQNDEPVDEDVYAVPSSFYGVGKSASEQYMRVFEHQYKLPCVALRLFNVYGPGQNLGNWKQGMVSIFLGQAAIYKKIHVKGDKNRFRDLIYIDDVVSAFVIAYQSSLPGYHYYNVCTGKKTTVEKLVNSIDQLFVEDIPVTYEGSTPGDTFGIYGSNKKISSELAWSPKVLIEDGLKKMYSWAIEQA